MGSGHVHEGPTASHSARTTLLVDGGPPAVVPRGPEPTVRMGGWHTCGMIDLMYLPGSANSSRVGRKVGHSGSSCADFASAQCLYEVPYRESVESHSCSSSLHSSSSSSCDPRARGMRRVRRSQLGRGCQCMHSV